MTEDAGDPHRQGKGGFRRVEVTVPKEDAELLRRIAKALVGGGPQADAVRKIIDERVPARKVVSMKEWLAESS